MAMFESTGGDIGQWISNLFSGSTAATGNLQNTINDPNLGPTSWSNTGTAQWNPTVSSTGGWNDKVGKALGDLSKTSKLGSSSTDSSSARTAASTGTSSAHAGQAPNLSSLVSELIKRRTPYFQMTGQPVEQGQTNRGLLGL